MKGNCSQVRHFQEERYSRAVRSFEFDFDKYLGPYTLSQFGEWKMLSNYITKSVIERIGTKMHLPAKDRTKLITTNEGNHNHPLPSAAMAMSSTTSSAARILLLGIYSVHYNFYPVQSAELFPTLAMKGKDRSLKGTVVYYDGQMNDSRVNVGLACTAALGAAAVMNHAEVVSFIKEDGEERIIGARIWDNLSGREFDTYAKVVANAGGPFCDSVRNLADKDAKPMICPSSGVQIMLLDCYST